MSKPQIPSAASDKKPRPHRARLVPREGEYAFTVNRTGRRRLGWADIYIRLLGAPWQLVGLLIVTSFLGVNLLFAIIFIILGDGIKNASPGSLADAFFFSVQTMSTIGYGQMAPVGLVANSIVTVEVLTGFIFIALVTGLVFSRFSRPTASVLFSNVAIISTNDDKPYLMMRLANERNSRIVDANVHMVILRKETTREGHITRRFYDLPLERSRLPLLQLTWTLMHEIDKASPLYQVTPDKLHEWDAEIVVSLTGIDETFSQTVHARQSYIADDIICNARFVDIVKRTEDGLGIDIDYTAFHEVKAIETV